MSGEAHVSSMHKESVVDEETWEFVGEGGKILGKIKHTKSHEVLVTDMSDGSVKIVPVKSMAFEIALKNAVFTFVGGPFGDERRSVNVKGEYCGYWPDGFAHPYVRSRVTGPSIPLVHGETGPWVMETDSEGISRFDFEIDYGRFCWTEDTLFTAPNLHRKSGDRVVPIRFRGLSWGYIGVETAHLRKWVT